MKMKKRYKEKKGTHTRKKMKSCETHQPYGVDAPHGPISGQWGGPTGTFWPTLATLHGYSGGIARETTHGPSVGGA